MTKPFVLLYLKYLRVTTVPSLLMVRPELERRILWKEVQGKRLVLLCFCMIQSTFHVFLINSYYGCCFCRTVSSRVMQVLFQELLSKFSTY